jgi:hypothetical protein
MMTEYFVGQSIIILQHINQTIPLINNLGLSEEGKNAMKGMEGSM